MRFSEMNEELQQEQVMKDAKEDITYAELAKSVNLDLVCDKFVPEKYKSQIKQMVKYPKTFKYAEVPTVITRDMVIKTRDNEYIVLYSEHKDGSRVFSCIFPAYHPDYKIKNPDLRGAVMFL